MSLRIVGFSLIATPLIVAAAVMVKALGWRAAALIWAITAATVAILITGSYLVSTP